MNMDSPSSYTVFDANGVRQAITRNPECAVVLCQHLGDNSTVKNGGRIVWKQGHVFTSFDRSAAIIDSATRSDVHGEAIRSLMRKRALSRFGHIAFSDYITATTEATS